MSAVSGREGRKQMAAVARSHVPRMITNRAYAKSLVRDGAEVGTLISRRGQPDDARCGGTPLGSN
jgi:hypothetical protein